MRDANTMNALVRCRSFFVAPVAAVTAGVIALGLAACEGCRGSGGVGGGAQTTATDAAPPSVRLYLVSDLAGALEPCGCTKDQLGGIDHFAAWVKSERARAPASFVAAAGPTFFMDDRPDPERAGQDKIKAQTIARVLHDVSFAAFAPGTNDWDEGPASLAALATASGATAIVAAPPIHDGPFAPVVMREVRVPGATPLEMAFVGFGQPPGGGPASDVESVVARGVESAKQQGANAIVALVAVGRGEAKRIAEATPDLTALVVGSARSGGDANTDAVEPERVGDVLVVEPGNHLQSVAVVDLYVRSPVERGKVVHFADGTGLELAQRRADLTQRIDDLRARIATWERDPKTLASDLRARRDSLAELERQRARLDVEKPAPVHGSFFRYELQPMRAALGKDAETAAEMSSYYKAVDEHNRVAFAGRLPPPHGPEQAIYVGVQACADCHAPAVQFWKGTAHARAYATLSSQFKEYNLDCVGCHVTGYEKPGGSTVTHVDRLRDVQCEVCHGPGSKHVISPLDEGTIIAKPQAATCLGCHHPPHVEHFDAVAKMKDILGPGHGEPLPGRSVGGR